MRSKEDAHDYRYFPEPDLLPLIIEQKWIDEQRTILPELPTARRNRFEKEYKLNPYAADILTSSRNIADYFEECISCFNDARQVANWFMGDVMRIMKEQKTGTLAGLAITPKRLGTLLKMIANGSVSAKAAKKVIDYIQEENKDPEVIVNEKGLQQVSDTGALEEVVKKILDTHPAEVERYKQGEKKLMGFFMGQAMKATKGTGNPKEVSSILSKLLNG